MSKKNKGRIGETRVIRVITDIMDVGGDVDFTRHTNTNTADSGADIVLEHPQGFVDKLETIATKSDTESTIPNLPPSEVITNTEKTRIDVKNTDRKLGKDTVIKFGGDIRKNPDCKNHILMGGSALTKGAKDELISLQTAHSQSGKTILHITNAGLINIESHYKSLNSPETNSTPEPSETKDNQKPSETD
ncbi:hypothetical protein [Dickeya poaceiphila]|uniref:Uncharacterized protein n=1 Tax=Dickeya poaceiphila TaxID=568768 RepID=A0A5B8HJE9_9GAMM|nr:hypothetical protein [Dickeya poaceiphila]QDX29466.1 hypothetical protein Dpoa569_0001231 [Dickeya poaceiphila]